MHVVSHPLHIPGSARLRSFSEGLWRLADPKIALASLVPFSAGAALVWRQTHQLDLLIAAAAFATIFLVEIGKNAVNDLYDFRSGADGAVLPEERSPFSGGKRVLIDSLLSERDLIVIAWCAFGLAAIVGTEVALITSPALLLLGAAAALMSVAYAMPPVRLAYRGLGELAVFAVYGPGIVLGTVLVLGGTIGLDSIATSLMLGILIFLVLLLNEFPDERADREAEKRTLVVRLGRERATALAAILLAVAWLPALLMTWSGEGAFFAAALLGAPIGAFVYDRLDAQRSGPPVLAQSAMLLTYVVTGAALAAAAVVTG